MALSNSTIKNLSIALTPDVIDDIFQDERYIELMMELIPEFVAKNLQSEDYDLVTEIAVSIMDNIAMKPRRTVWQLAQEELRRPQSSLILNKSTNHWTDMDFDTFDTDLWSEIQDAPGEIFDIDEMMEEEQTWNEFVNSNVTVWQVAQGVLCSHKIPAILHLLRGKKQRRFPTTPTTRSGDMRLR